MAIAGDRIFGRQLQTFKNQIKVGFYSSQPQFVDVRFDVAIIRKLDAPIADRLQRVLDARLERFVRFVRHSVVSWEDVVRVSYDTGNVA